MMQDPDSKSSQQVANPLDRVNLELMNFTPHGAARVLALGCGDGVVASRRRLWRPDVAIFGQDAASERAALAAAVLDDVHDGAAESLSPQDLMRGRAAGVVTIADGFAQAADPAGLLARLAAAMEPDGTLALSFAPANGAELIAALVAGRMDEAEALLGGARHLLTLEHVVAMARAAGLVEAGAKPQSVDPARAEKLAKSLATMFAQGPAAERLAGRLMAARWLIRFTRAAPSRLWLQSMTLRPVGGVNEVRINQPFAFMAAEPGVTMRIEERNANFAGMPDQPRLFIWQRPILTREAHLKPLKQLRTLGLVQVTEFDDHPLVWPAIADNDYLNYRGVHAVQTSTPALVELFRQWNPEVALFGNAMAEVPPPRPARDPDAPVTIFFGALNRDKDWAPILPALNAVLKKTKRKVRVEIVHDRKLFDAIETKDKQFAATCPYPAYLERLRRADIALLPLAPGLFNGMKSDLKFLECAASGAVAVASPTVYENSLRDGETGVLFRDADEFARELDSLIADDARRERIAAAARAWLCDGRLLWQQTARRLAWYRDLWDRRDALDRALVERVPEIG